MKLIAFVLALAALGGASSQARVLGWDYEGHELRWFDPASLNGAPGKRAAYASSVCSWAYAPNRRHVAISDCRGQMAFFAVPSLKSEGRITWTSLLGNAGGVAWLAPQRIVAVSTVGSDASTLVTIDPVQRRVVARRDLGGSLAGRALVGNEAVYLVVPAGRFGAPRIVVVAAAGSVRMIEVTGLSVGTVTSSVDDGTPSFDLRRPGFAVDGATRHAYVVGDDLTVFDVDLRSGSVTRHGPERRLAKALNGWTRAAAWLGNGVIAVAGADMKTTGSGTSSSVETQPFGLRLVDTRTWVSRIIDAGAISFDTFGGRAVVRASSWTAYDRAGERAYDVPAPEGTWLNVAGAHGYVCTDREAIAVLDAATGARTSIRGRPCATLLVGRASQY